MELKQKEEAVVMTYAEMMDPLFLNALSKLLNMPTEVKIGNRVRHWLGRYQTEIERHMKVFQEDRVKLLEQYTNKGEDGKAIMVPIHDEKGEPVVGQNGPLQRYDVPQEKMEELNKEINEMMEGKCVFPFFKISIKLDEFPECLLSHEMVALERIIEWT